MSKKNRIASLLLFYAITSSFLHGEITIDGNNSTLELSATSTLTVPAGNPLRIKDLTITGLKQDRIICMSTTSKLILENSNLVIDDNFSYTQGVIEIKGKCSISTTTTFDATFTYSGHRIEIDSASTLELRGPNLTFNCQPDSGIRRPIFFYDQSSVLNVNNATLKNGNDLNGILFLSGKLKIDGSSTLDAVVSFTDKGFILGGPKHNDAADTILAIAPDAQLTVSNTSLVFRNNQPTSFKLASDQSSIKVEPGATVTFETQAQPPNGLQLKTGLLDLFGTTSIDLNGTTLNLESSAITQQTGTRRVTTGTSTTLSNINFSAINVINPKFSHNGKYISISNSFAFAEAFTFYVHSITSTYGVDTFRGRGLQSFRSSITPFSPSGKFIASRNNSNSGSLHIFAFDTLNGPESIDLTTITSIVLSTSGEYSAWSPDGRFLAINSGSNVLVYSWNGSNLSLLTSVSCASPVANFDWSSNQEFLVVGTQNSVEVYKFSDEKNLSRTDFLSTGIVDDLNISPDGRYLVYMDEDIRIYELDENGHLTSVYIGGGSATLPSSRWSEDGNFLLFYNTTFSASIFRFDKPSVTVMLTKSLGTGDGGVAWSPDSKIIGSIANSTNFVASHTVPRETPEGKIEIEDGTIKLAQDFTLFSGKIRFS